MTGEHKKGGFMDMVANVMFVTVTLWIMLPQYKRDRLLEKASELRATIRFRAQVWMTVVQIRNLPES